jgi:alkyl hydroperoxide reductase subunit F
MSSTHTARKDRYDVVVIGAGPAGLTAAMYAARQGLGTAVVAGVIGGQAMWAKHIDNFIGWQLISGPDLIERFREHVNRFNVDCYEGNLVNAIVSDGSGEFDVFSREGLALHTATVIIASGKPASRLAIPGEDELVGHGVSYCATCDAAFFAGKAVAVVGPGESAADAALELSRLGASPIAVVSERELRAPAEVLGKLREDAAITLYERATPLRVEGEDRVERLVVESGGQELALDVAGVFIELGAIKADDFAMGLVEVNERGEIVVDKSGMTSTPGIYAAGDVTDEFGKQILTAAGLGARAAMAANRDLLRRPERVSSPTARS